MRREMVEGREAVMTHTISRSSLMPEGLIEHLPEMQVVDLFAHLKSLK